MEEYSASKQKLSWPDCTENDLKSMGVKKWRKGEDKSGRDFILRGGTD